MNDAECKNKERAEREVIECAVHFVERYKRAKKLKTSVPVTALPLVDAVEKLQSLENKNEETNNQD